MHIYDLVGVGIGPFNLSLAALLDNHQIDCLFLEQKSQFDWHGGMMLDGATLQVPFMADLVTMADPTSPYSFLNYLKNEGRLYPFFYKEDLFIKRMEYNHYCQWVAAQLASCQFSSLVVSVQRLAYQNESLWLVESKVGQQIKQYAARHLVLGLGSTPSLPAAVKASACRAKSIFHSSDYLPNKKQIAHTNAITILGSGQSAAEIVLDVLSWKSPDAKLNWLTRSKGFFPMEYSNLGLEHFSPDYIDYFYELTPEKKKSLIKSQDLLYKGISFETITDIYKVLYHESFLRNQKPVILANSELTGIEGVASYESDSRMRLQCYHLEQALPFSVESDCLICATGYEPYDLSRLKGMTDYFKKDSQGNWIISRDYRLILDATDKPSTVFVQNAEPHSHGVSAPDLTLAAYRSSVIVNSLLGHECYKIDINNTFTNFGVPEAFMEFRADGLQVVR